MSSDTSKAPKNVKGIFRASITLKDGRVIYAKDYGKRAFFIPLDV